MGEDTTGTPTISEHALLALAVACAALLSLVTTVHGPGISPDSVTYLTTALDFADAGRLTALDGTPLTVFPPMMSLLGALSETLGIGAATGIRFFVAACAAALVYCSHLLLRRTEVRLSVLWFSTFLIAVSPIVLNVAKMAWSETPFMLVCVAFLLVAQTPWTTRRVTPSTLALLVGLTWLGFLFRYAGVALIPAGAAILVAATRPTTVRTLTRVAAYVVGASVVPVAWMVRNHAVDGTWLGPRSSSLDTPTSVLARIFGTVGSWVVPVDALPRVATVVIGVTLVALVAVVVARGPVARCGPSAVLLVVYVGYLAAAQLTTAISPIGSRLLSPAYVPLVLVTSVAVDTVLARLPARRRRTWARGVVVACASLLAVAQLDATRATVGEGVRDGIGYNAQRWRDLELAAVTRRHVDRHPSTVYSNVRDALWVATGIRPVRQAPARRDVRGHETPAARRTFARAVACSPQPVVLAVHDNGDGRFYSADELRGVVDLVEVASVPRGHLYSVTAPDDCG